MDAFDHDQSGGISEAEYEATLTAICEANGYEPTDEDIAQAEALFAEADADGDGEVDKAEVEVMMEKYMWLTKKTKTVLWK